MSREVVDFGKFLDDQGDITGLVAFAAVGRGGQVGGVGFGDDVGQGYLVQESGDWGFFEGDDAVDAQ